MFSWLAKYLPKAWEELGQNTEETLKPFAEHVILRANFENKEHDSHVYFSF